MQGSELLLWQLLQPQPSTTQINSLFFFPPLPKWEKERKDRWDLPGAFFGVLELVRKKKIKFPETTKKHGLRNKPTPLKDSGWEIGGAARRNLSRHRGFGETLPAPNTRREKERKLRGSRPRIPAEGSGLPTGVPHLPPPPLPPRPHPNNTRARVKQREWYALKKKKKTQTSLGVVSDRWKINYRKCMAKKKKKWSSVCLQMDAVPPSPAPLRSSEQPASAVPTPPPALLLSVESRLVPSKRSFQVILERKRRSNACEGTGIGKQKRARDAERGSETPAFQREHSCARNTQETFQSATSATQSVANSL